MTIHPKSQKIRPHKPPRPYGQMVRALTKVLKIFPVPQEEAILNFGQAQKDSLPAEGLSICVWNICKGAGGVLFEHDFHRLLRHHDLLLTQEALLSERSIRLYHGEGVEVLHAASYKRLDGLRDGVMTMAKTKAVGQISRLMCKVPEPILKTPKVGLLSYYNMAGADSPLMVINIHARLIRTIKGSIKELEHLIEQIPSHRGPVIIAGDFNTFSLGYLQVLQTLFGEIGMDYVKLENDYRAKTAALDQIFVKGLIVKKALVDFSVQSSDHFPLFVEVSAK